MGWIAGHTSTRRRGLGSQTVIAIAAAAQPDEAPTTNAVKNAMVIIHPSCAGPFGNDLLRGSFPDVLQAAQSRAAAEVAFAATRADVVRVQAGPRPQRLPVRTRRTVHAKARGRHRCCYHNDRGQVGKGSKEMSVVLSIPPAPVGQQGQTQIRPWTSNRRRSVCVDELS